MEDSGLKHLYCCTTCGFRVGYLGVLENLLTTESVSVCLHMLPSSSIFLLTT